MNEVANKEFGVNLWWTVPEFVMNGELAQAAMEDNGFEADKDLPLPSKRKVVSRAVYSFQDRRHKEGRRVTEKAKENGTCVVYGILNQKQKGEEEVGYDQNTTVRLDKESGRVEVEGSQVEEFYKALDIYEDSTTDEDIRGFLRNVVRMCFGIAKRPSGGIYFVPERYIGIIESAQQVLEDLNVGARLYIERVMNGEQERAIVWEAVETDIEAQLDQTLKAVERIEKRASSVTSHQAKLDELGSLMEIYQHILGEEAKYEELAERLEEASNTVAAKLDKLQQEALAPKKTGTGVKTKRKKVGDVMPVVEKVMAAAGEAIHYTKIAELVEAEGFELRETQTKSKAQWLLIQINKAVKGNDTKIEALGRGVYK